MMVSPFHTLIHFLLGGCDYDNGLKYIKGKFLSMNPVEDRQIEVVICTSTETNTVKEVFEKIEKTVVQMFDK
jgi:hypothetical protein